MDHFSIPILISLCVLVALLMNRKQIYKKGKWSAFWISLTVFFAVYLLLLTGVIFLEYHYDVALQKFDLNGDGNFSGDEITSEQQIAMRNVTNDLGRTFAAYTGVFISGFIASAVFLVGKIIEYIRKEDK